MGIAAMVLLAAASVVLLPPAVPPAAAESSKDAVESSVDSDQIQRDRPGEVDAAGNGGAATETGQDRTRKSIEESESQGDIQRDRPADAPPPEIHRFSLPDLGWLPYVIIGVIAVALLLVLIRYLHFRGDRSRSAAAAAQPKISVTARAAAEGPAPPERDRTFDEVDALAAAGAFTEAVHRLLLLVQGRLRHRIEHGFQASLTSREILRRARLSGEAATAFATLVAAVEVSLFGMQAANAATYALCREQSARVLAAAAETGAGSAA
jgi:hypothetical protein